MATSTLRALVIAGAVLVGALVLSKGFGETASNAVPNGGPQVARTSSPSVHRTPTTQPPRTTAPPVSNVTVQVLNGTSTAKLASSQGQRLTTAGYKVDFIGNASNTDHTTIYYLPNAKAAADNLKAAFYPTAVEQPAPSQYRNTMLTVILGADFTSTG